MLVDDGLVGGPSQANHLATALLRAQHDHQPLMPKLVVSHFVDDLKMHTKGTTRQVVYIFSQVAVELFHAFAQLKVDLSPSKCGLLAHHTWHCSHLCAQVGEKKRVLVFLRANTRVILVSTSPSVHVLSRLQGKESKRAAMRWRHIGGFAKGHQRACRLLFKGGALPQSTYGRQIWCILPTAMQRLRAAAAWTSDGYRVPPLCFPSQKPSQHLVCFWKSSLSISCFCAITLC